MKKQIISIISIALFLFTGCEKELPPQKCFDLKARFYTPYIDSTQPPVDSLVIHLERVDVPNGKVYHIVRKNLTLADSVIEINEQLCGIQYKYSMTSYGPVANRFTSFSLQLNYEITGYLIENEPNNGVWEYLSR